MKLLMQAPPTDPPRMESQCTLQPTTEQNKREKKKFKKIVGKGERILFRQIHQPGTIESRFIIAFFSFLFFVKQPREKGGYDESKGASSLTHAKDRKNITQFYGCRYSNSVRCWGRGERKKDFFFFLLVI